MPGVIRMGVDASTGHPPYPPRPADQGSPNWNCNTIPIVRLNDHWPIHCAGSCHDGVTAQGSPNWKTNGKPKMRAGDAISCGDRAGAHSPNWKVNG